MVLVLLEVYELEVVNDIVVMTCQWSSMIEVIGVVAEVYIVESVVGIVAVVE